ncbi:MAG: ATP-binding protein [Bacteroidales bacterium]|nr:ATP-binding protein [Bacteroidales bacterium]
MDSAFTYGSFVTGKYFLGRKKDVNILSNLIAQRENIVLLGGPKSGKTSLIQQVFLQMRLEKKSFLTAEINLRDVRDTVTFLRRLGDAVIRVFATTPAEFRDLVASQFSGTHFVFDPRSFSESGGILSLNWDPDEKDIHALLTLPWSLARIREERLILVLREFQNIRFFDGWEKILRAMEDVVKEQRSFLEKPACSFILSGSQLNAMKDLFVHWRWFYRLAEVHTPSPIDENEITEHVVRGFLAGGKVVDREMLRGAISLLQGNLHYINHFFAICDHLSKGYIMEPILIEALADLVAIHEPRFNAMMYDLTNYQVNLLRALAEGHTRFSSAEVIRQYGLNSSANVKRLKDALAKKEIITFSDGEEPVFIDPLFEYWVKKYFFGQKLDF